MRQDYCTVISGTSIKPQEHQRLVGKINHEIYAAKIAQVTILKGLLEKIFRTNQNAIFLCLIAKCGRLPSPFNLFTNSLHNNYALWQLSFLSCCLCFRYKHRFSLFRDKNTFKYHTAFICYFKILISFISIYSSRDKILNFSILKVEFPKLKEENQTA